MVHFPVCHKSVWTLQTEKKGKDTTDSHFSGIALCLIMSSKERCVYAVWQKSTITSDVTTPKTKDLFIILNMKQNYESPQPVWCGIRTKMTSSDQSAKVHTSACYFGCSTYCMLLCPKRLGLEQIRPPTPLKISAYWRALLILMDYSTYYNTHPP